VEFTKLFLAVDDSISSSSDSSDDEIKQTKVKNYDFVVNNFEHN
jgi:hypothetical protein